MSTYTGNPRQPGVPQWAWDTEVDIPPGYEVENCEAGAFLMFIEPTVLGQRQPTPGRLARDLRAANPHLAPPPGSQVAPPEPMPSTMAELRRLGGRPLLTPNDGPRLGWAAYEDDL